MSDLSAVSSELEACAASFVKEHRLPGAAVGVVDGDGLAWSVGVGFADVAARERAEATTLFRVASITKTFTGTAIMQLRDAGRLHLDDPAVAHLPELRHAATPFGAIETVTIRRLLSHESGLASEPPGTDWAIPPAYEGAADRTLARVAEIGTKVPPNLQPKYSNLGYQLLGEIVERVSGAPYPRYVSEAILDPLDMGATGFEPLPDALAPRRATGYLGRVFSDELQPAPAMPPVWAEGGLWSCVHDLARWVSFQLRAYRDTADERPVLAASQLREMHRPRYLGNEEWTEAWGISWYAVRREDLVWIQHSGGLHGFTSNVCFDPKTQVGAIVLLNGIADPSALAMDLATIAQRKARAKVPVIEPPAAMPEAFRPLLGMYADREWFIRLEWRDGQLTFVDPDTPAWRPTIAATDDPNVFVVGPGCRQSGEPVIFHRLADGRVASVFLAASTLVRLGPVT